MRRGWALAFALCAISLSTAAFAQPADPCAKLLLFPLHDPGLALPENDRSFFTLHDLCLTELASESEARDSGVDLKLAYASAGVPPGDASRFDQLKAWQQAHCPEYLTPRNEAKLGSIVNSILARESPAVRQEYERCRTSQERPSCHAIPVGADAVALLVLAPPAAPSVTAGRGGPAGPAATAPNATEPPEVTEVRAAGLLLPDTFDRSATGGDPLPVEVPSLANLQIPPAACCGSSPGAAAPRRSPSTSRPTSASAASRRPPRRTGSTASTRSAASTPPGRRTALLPAPSSSATTSGSTSPTCTRRSKPSPRSGESRPPPPGSRTSCRSSTAMPWRGSTRRTRPRRPTRSRSRTASRSTTSSSTSYETTPTGWPGPGSSTIRSPSAGEWRSPWASRTAPLSTPGSSRTGRSRTARRSSPSSRCGRRASAAS